MSGISLQINFVFFASVGRHGPVDSASQINQSIHRFFLRQYSFITISHFYLNFSREGE